MEPSSRVIIGIELGLLEKVIRTILCQEIAETLDEIKQTLISKRKSLLQEDRLFTPKPVNHTTLYQSCVTHTGTGLLIFAAQLFTNV